MKGTANDTVSEKNLEKQSHGTRINDTLYRSHLGRRRCHADGVYALISDPPVPCEKGLDRGVVI